jgi:hypothetical protein
MFMTPLEIPRAVHSPMLSKTTHTAGGPRCLTHAYPVAASTKDLELSSCHSELFYDTRLNRMRFGTVQCTAICYPMGTSQAEQEPKAIQRKFRMHWGRFTGWSPEPLPWRRGGAVGKVCRTCRRSVQDAQRPEDHQAPGDAQERLSEACILILDCREVCFSRRAFCQWCPALPL